VLERHPQIGYRMLDSLGVEPVATWVLHHHERWDGAGYPDGLAGDAIPMPARLMAVADVYDAVCSARVYKAAGTHEQAGIVIVKGRGTQFDPDVVDAFIDIAGEFQAIALKYPD